MNDIDILYTDIELSFYDLYLFKFNFNFYYCCY